MELFGRLKEDTKETKESVHPRQCSTSCEFFLPIVSKERDTPKPPHNEPNIA